ncbi:MAG: type II secretion system F family protein, partial [Candidatus Limnocylindrales bacterium]
MGSLGPFVVAGLIGAAIFVVFLGLAGRRGSDLGSRIERYASAVRPDAPRADAGQGAITDRVSRSATLAGINRAVESGDFGANLARDLARADLALKVSEYLLAWVGTTLGVPLVLLVAGRVSPGLANPLVLLVGAVVGFFLPRLWLNRRQASRLGAFNSHLADTITLIANALRAGSSFLQAIELVVRETQPPISTEFGRVIREVNLGLTFDDALQNMVRRVRSDDLELMATAITIQHQVGGNLAEIMDSIAFTIRERVRIKGEIKTLTAQQRMSGLVVGLLPIGLAAILFVIAPGFMEPMFLKPPEFLGLPMGVVILFIGGFFMFLGFMAIRRI